MHAPAGLGTTLLIIFWLAEKSPPFTLPFKPDRPNKYGLWAGFGTEMSNLPSVLWKMYKGRHLSGAGVGYTWCSWGLMRGCLELAFSCVALLVWFPSRSDLCGGEQHAHWHTASAVDTQVAFWAVGNIRGRWMLRMCLPSGKVCAQIHLQMLPIRTSAIFHSCGP